jgi:hypothetical protein
MPRIDVRRAHCSRLLPGMVLQATTDAVSTTIPIAFTPQYYGNGQRAWVTCPWCRRRRIALFVGRGGRIACRVCLRLTYQSQYEPLDVRLERRVQALTERLAWVGEGLDAVPVRPKGMHRRTFRRLVARIRQLDWAVEAERDRRMWPALLRLVARSRDRG